jgi:hypothetical protein
VFLLQTKEISMKNNHTQISDYFTAIADLLGLPASEFRITVEAASNIWDKAKSDKLKEQENLIWHESVHRRLIRDYYDSTKGKSKFQQYNLLISSRKYSSTIFTTPNRVGLSLPLSDIETSYTPNAQEPTSAKRISKIIRKQATNVSNKFDQMGVRFWDQDIYRLVGDPFLGEKLKLSFSLSRYLDYRFTSGLLEDEVFDALIANGNDTNYVLKERASALPIRTEILPTTNSLIYLSERISAGGIACVVAMARGYPYNDYCIPLQLRSQSVAEARGVYTGSLQAWHQPIVGDHKNEVSLYWTVLREMFEELYGGGEVIEESSRLRYDWYLKECPGVDYIHKNPDNVSLEFLGIGVNAILGTYNCAILLAIHDTEYWEKYSSAMVKNWENKKWLLLSTKDDVMPSIENVFNKGWFDPGMFGLSQALLRLRQLDEKRVQNLDIGYELS